MNRKLNLSKTLSRDVLFEKYNKQYVAINLLSNLLNDSEIVKSEIYPESLFFIKNKHVLLEQNFADNGFHVNYERVWQKIELEVNLGYVKLQKIIGDFLEANLNVKEFYTRCYSLNGGKFEAIINAK